VRDEDDFFEAYLKEKKERLPSSTAVQNEEEEKDGKKGSLTKKILLKAENQREKTKRSRKESRGISLPCSK